MTSAGVRIGVGASLLHDGELVEIVEIHTGQTGMDVVLKGTSKQALIRARLNELLMSSSTRVIPERDGPCSLDDFEPAAVVIAQLSDVERNEVIERAAHVREVLTGFRSGSEELALPGEPRPEYQADIPLSRTQAKRANLARGCVPSSVGFNSSRSLPTKRVPLRSANTVVLRWGFVEGQPIEISAAQMISLIDLFPSAELRTAPTPQPPAGLKSVPGRSDAHLLEDVKNRACELGLSGNELNAAAYSSWLETTAAQSPP